ncbi:conserved hypothetical protein [Candidatus Terasakiella magnetica]|uniref:Uncharacterized protein n=1 Tax=Candidatus Terasakiella magnetica TaxID=1867952 RepID=A0A1C3RF38_9PROT|nr:hypothetical protein [Candidatus Terasakiella magnetica]SCA55906.1 conserved hypothetical protein [Candidatus Terasakiella magnetica]
MSKFDANQMIAHLQDKWGDNTCQMCGSKKWNVSDTIYELNEYHGGNDGQVLPVVPVACGNCGITVFVNAFVSGVL